MISDTPLQRQSFKLSNFLNVDASDDPAAYIGFLDRFATERREMIDIGIDLLRLRQGAAVLDAGCGHGAIIPMLASRVGASGRVMGIDLSRQLVAEAHRRFDGSGLPVKIRAGHAEALDFADATFDAARADRVLVFVPNPRAAVLELARVTRPGGRVVVTEPDLGASMVDSPDTAATREVLACVCDGFPNGWVGRQLRAMFLDAGLIDLEVRCFTTTNTSLSDWGRNMGIDDALRTAVTLGRISVACAEAWLGELRGRDETGRFLAATTLYMVAASKPERDAIS